MATAILAIIAAALPIIAALVKWWLDTRPERAVKKAREENAEIEDAANRGDADYFNERIGRWMSEDD